MQNIFIVILNNDCHSVWFSKEEAKKQEMVLKQYYDRDNIYFKEIPVMNGHYFS